MRKQAQVCKEKGIGIFGLTLEQRKANGSKGGNSGKQSAGGKLSRHRVYHRDRNLFNPLCELCNPAAAEQIAVEADEVDEYAEAWEATQIRHKTISVSNCRCAGCAKLQLKQ